MTFRILSSIYQKCIKQTLFQAFKTWEHNGRQVGQLWMLSETTLKKECKKYNLDEDGNKIELITRLGRTIKDRERKMLTMGPAHEKLISHDVTPIHKVDEEDLPKVILKRSLKFRSYFHSCS